MIAGAGPHCLVAGVASGAAQGRCRIFARVGADTPKNRQPQVRTGTNLLNPFDMRLVKAGT
jgi:hypothetical protein